MVWAWSLSILCNDSYVLGEATLRATSSEMKAYMSWFPAKDGAIHPALCEVCGRLIRKELIEPDLLLRQDTLDLSVTYEGYLVVSDCSRRFFLTHSPELKFRELSHFPGFFLLDHESVEILNVDVAGSGVRFGDRCPNCGGDAMVLYGIEDGLPPRSKPVVFKDMRTPLVRGLYRSDICFGESFNQSPIFILGASTGEEFSASGIKGADLCALRCWIG